MNYVHQRRANLFRELKAEAVDAVLVTNPRNVTYLSGFHGDSSYLILTPKQAILVSDSRFEEELRDENPELEAVIRPHTKTIQEATAETLTKLAVKSIGFESNHVSMALLESLKEKGPKLSFAPIGPKIEQLRSIKDPSEIEQVRDAVRIAERAFHMFQAFLTERDSEKDCVDAMESYLRRAGAKCSAFPTIVSYGERGALPHARPTNRMLLENSKLLVDWGADAGYKSDMTRTFRSPYNPAPNRKNRSERVGMKFQEIFDAVVQAQQAAADALKHGTPAKDVDSAARKVLDTYGLNDYFTHGLGHGIGLDVHEAPQIRQSSEAVLEAGMIVTLEPAVYIAGWGGVRVEDMYLITKDDAPAIRLTTLPSMISAVS